MAQDRLTATENELKIMTAALPVVEAVPESQDSCWPGDGPAHADDCAKTDHDASTAAVAATQGLSWEFSTWASTAARFRAAIEEAEANRDEIEENHLAEDDMSPPAQETTNAAIIAAWKYWQARALEVIHDTRLR